MISDSLRARMEELCDTIQQISGINPRINSRKSDYVSVRSMVAQVLTDEGASESDVGELFGKNHATVAHYKKRMTFIDSPGWQAEKELWIKFQKAIGIFKEKKRNEFMI